MATNYLTEGYVILDDVEINGSEGNTGSTLSWTGLLGSSDSDLDITDANDNGVLDVGIDYFLSNSYKFSGYTVTGTNGTEYPVFFESISFGGGSPISIYYVPLSVDGNGQTLIPSSGTTNLYQDPASDTYLCFAAGTQIATPTGEQLVETLSIGDQITTSDGKTVAVKWIGQQTVMTRFGPAERLMPVRFTAGSLGPNMPHTDLTVTADHAMLVDGVLCNAGALVNGTSIKRVPLAEMGETYTVYHIETEEHEFILANGAPAETFIDNVSRRVFDNFAEYEALYGDEAEMEELPLPRATSARQVPAAIKTRLAGRVAA